MGEITCFLLCPNQRLQFTNSINDHLHHCNWSEDSSVSKGLNKKDHGRRLAIGVGEPSLGCWGLHPLHTPENLSHSLLEAA